MLGFGSFIFFASVRLTGEGEPQWVGVVIEDGLVLEGSSFVERRRMA